VEKQGPAIAADPQAIATIEVTPRNAESPLTIAVNCAVVPDGTFALAGEITTETGNGLRIGRASPNEQEYAQQLRNRTLHFTPRREFFVLGTLGWTSGLVGDQKL
jgi:hypothetical protein